MTAAAKRKPTRDPVADAACLCGEVECRFCFPNQPEINTDWKRSMYEAAIGLLGRGYVPDYYHSAASEFIQIAEWEIARQVKNATARARRKAVTRPPARPARRRG